MSQPREPIIPSIQKGIAKRWQSIENGTREWWRGYRSWLNAERNQATATLSPSSADEISALPEADPSLDDRVQYGIPAILEKIIADLQA